MSSPALSHRKERGQSLVEMGISMILILTLLTGAVETGRAFFILVSLRDAAQEGVVFGSIQPCIDTNQNTLCDSGEGQNIAAIQGRAREVLIASLRDGTAPDANIEVAFTGPLCAGSTIAVTASYTYTTVLPLFTGITIPLRTTVTNTVLFPMCQ